MTDWKEYTISDIAILNYGKSLTDNNREAGTVPVYGSGGIIGYHSKAIVNSGLIIGRKGTVGSLFMEKKPFFPIDTVYFIDKLIDEKKQDLTFFFYLLKTINFENFNNDAAVPGLNRNLVYKLKVFTPPLETQQKIANILGSYDELIEVNNQRIKTLEETAQALYKEWFVRFRFPDYQNTEFIKGIPKGWEVKEIKDLAEVTSSKRVFLEDYVESGIPFYRGKEITLKSNNEPINDILYITLEKFNEVKRKFGVPKKGDLLITAVGTIGNVHLVSENDGEFYFKDGNLIWLKNVKNQSLSTFLFFYLKSEEMISRFDSVAIGSSQKALTIAAIKKINILLPKNDLVISFSKIIIPLIDQIETLQQQNAELRQIRDRLLPRLISGKITV